ncbi:MAG: DUF3226 domain-containing protein [Chitinophagales bacterium]
MAKTLSLLFCEGKDEPPYIYRLLKADGWSNKTDQTLDNYPDVLRKYIVSELAKTSALSDTDPWNRGIGVLPWYILQKKLPPTNPNKHFIVIWQLGGESRYDLARPCIESFLVAIDSEFEETEEFSLQIVFFYDADEAISNRIEAIQKHYKELLPDFCTKLQIDQAIQTYKNVDECTSIGVFVFANEEGSGALEDHLIPLMRKDNEAVFSAAEEYMDKFEGNRPKKFSRQKALIGITGQLQKPGKSNSVMITDCKYITNTKINADENVQKLIHFIRGIIELE